MATVSNFALRLPPSLMEDVRVLAAQDAVSVNQFVVQATAEKVAALKARGYLAERAERAKPGALSRVLAKAGTPTPVEGDAVPEGWLTAPSATQAGG